MSCLINFHQYTYCFLPKVGVRFTFLQLFLKHVVDALLKLGFWVQVNFLLYHMLWRSYNSRVVPQFLDVVPNKNVEIGFEYPVFFTLGDNYPFKNWKPAIRRAVTEVNLASILEDEICELTKQICWVRLVLKSYLNFSIRVLRAKDSYFRILWQLRIFFDYCQLSWT